MSDHSVGSLPVLRIIWGAAPDQGQDTDAVFTEHYHRYRLRLYGFLRRRLVTDDAEELTQETFARFYAHLRAGRPIPHPKAWLYTVASNLISDTRRRQRMQSLCLPVDAVAIPCPHEQIEERLERVRRDALIVQAIAQLPPLQRQCFEARVDGLRLREIAERLGCTTSTVAVSLTRAIKAIRFHLQRHGVSHGRER